MNDQTTPIAKPTIRGDVDTQIPAEFAQLPTLPTPDGTGGGPENIELPEATPEQLEKEARMMRANLRRQRKLSERGYRELKYRQPKYDKLGNMLSPKADAKRQLRAEVEKWTKILFPKRGIKYPLSPRGVRVWRRRVNVVLKAIQLHQEQQREQQQQASQETQSADT